MHTGQVDATCTKKGDIWSANKKNKIKKRRNKPAFLKKYNRYFKGDLQQEKILSMKTFAADLSSPGIATKLIS